MAVSKWPGRVVEGMRVAALLLIAFGAVVVLPRLSMPYDRGACLLLLATGFVVVEVPHWIWARRRKAKQSNTDGPTEEG